MSKTVVITGANRGLGLELCQQYLEGGCKVYACCRAPELAQTLLALKQKAGDRMEIIPLNVVNPTQVANLKYTLQDESIDLLINNAGMYGEHQSFGEVSEQEWMKVLQVNTIAPLLIVQALVDRIANGGSIALMSSKMGSIDENTSGGQYIYRSSKAALNAVGKSLAHDLAEKNINVAVCHPGWVQTDMGGANALIDTKASINGLRSVIDRLTPENSGQFFSYDGTNIPW